MMSGSIVLVFSLFGLFSACVGQYVQPGQCNDNIGLVQNFDLTQFLGTWHEIRRSDNPNQLGQCSSFVFTRGANNALTVSYNSVNNNFEENGRGTFAQEGSTARLTLTIPTFENPMRFWVQMTDYTTYALVSSCENISAVQRRIHIWVLGRQPTAINEMTMALITTRIRDTFNIESNTLKTISHSTETCYTLPVIQAGNPILIPGQCDQNIRAVPNFNVSRFLGVWHQIQSYDSANSNGGCVRAQYTLGDGRVNVLNSQVINQNLLTIEGSATVSSTDGSAQLSVLLNIPGSPTPVQQTLWVLGSDYENWAVSYSCENVSPTQKRVYSWILSRRRQLASNFQAAVDQVVNSFLDLNYRYYTPTDQSDAGCFFLPTPVPNTPVTFRGQCQSVNVRAMANFDAQRYMGLWHNIELYPTGFQSGTCATALYELTSNGVDVLNAEVINQRRETIRGVAVPVATDGSAQLVVTFPTPVGQSITTDYWVLDTDYTNFALVYSCTNINEDEMRVTSWKLSRSKQLSANSISRINAIINAVSVLDQRYYQVMDQTEQGCFYVPEAVPGQPVVFPGQCDTNVPVVANLNFAQFIGTWYEIQAYPKNEQTGQCINHQYSLADSNRLNLVSSSVTDQFLGVTNGVVTRSTATDTSGRLTITIQGANGQNINIPFWILSTDYNNYALAYACTNVDAYTRAVWSWKLSRSKTLSAASNTAINAVIANNVVLDNKYYENIDQSDAACFYLPEIERGEPIILPGVCDRTITGIPNFNLAQFAGRWRLIESYGAERQSGTCNVAQYDLQGNSFRVINSQVVNAELRSVTGTATIPSDGSGRLQVSINNNNFDMYILDTDYTNYALAYGCENLANNRRRVYSWKMSRRNTFTAAAINNMNRIIDSIEVLNNRYYYVVDRSETGCFYYPTPDPNNQVVFRGQCNQLPVVTNFRAEQYLGLWHDIESYPGDFQTGTCNNALYTAGANGVVNVLNTQVVNQALATISGTATLETSTDGSAKLKVTFVVGGQTRTRDYWILATDYNSYSLVYSCRTIDDEFIQVTSWKLSRQKTLSTAARNAINAVMANIPVLDQRYFITRDHSANGCFYYPEPRPGVPVRFPGVCDQTIAAQPNFNMNQFQGTWHEIEAYPQENQSGQCRNHRFTISGSTINLQSSSVYNQALSATTGTVQVTSTDGSGRLTITTRSPTGQVTTTPFWILSTDYNNYALAYSCVQDGQDFRIVSSWKLSKTKQLSNAANTAINNAMQNINVLRNNYFETVQQTDSACFYLPNLGPRDPVEFPGRCDPNIPVMRNFNINRYLGRWRLIETYYSEFQEGTCNAATYSRAPDGSVVVVNSKVANQQLETITGSAVLASSDGSGKLLVTLPSSSTPMELWILDTDYDSYSLLYSCSNVGNDRRRVWSWKMSKTNTLTAAATTNINRIVNSIDVLNNRYYQTVDRSAAGCFYYPTPDSSTNVIFPGQCEQNIPVVTNFNPTAYAGVWYDIESYPTRFQSGTCNTATYTLNPDGTVGVQNTQVVNQVLQTTTGVAVASTTDGSAKFDVTLVTSSGNVTTKYWVLATDYNSYSLVYSCTNVDDEYRAVYSWKLGRQTTLSTAANAVINNVINNVQVLDQRYYVRRSHTQEACFYYPDLLGGDVILNGRCVADAQVPAVTNFNANSFTGTWHEVARFPSALQNGECTNTQYTLDGANRFSITKTSIRDEARLTTTTQGTVPANGRGVININVNGVPFNNIYILATDYSEYALAYACRELDANTKQIYSWKLSRSRAGLSTAANNAINQVVSNNIDLHEPYYRTTSQTNAACFYYPVFTQPPPVIELPGPCDTSIRGVPNFNTQSFLGRWFDTARYPQTAQSGQCNRAEYGPVVNGAVTVVNSQVINQALSTITGTARTTSTDGSGQLEVNFVVGGETRLSNLYVLATDYTSYALLYSCVNLPNGNRQVGSWKMSRSATLSSQAAAAMEPVIRATQGLKQDYYQSTSQTDESCFYIPAVNPNAAPLFRGQCEDITGVQAFNAQRFLGWWHEIERYPSDVNVGQCISSQYSQSGNLIRVVDTSVANLVASTSEGTVTISNNGRIRRTLSNNVVEDIWVLATDYDNYALLYSCTNVNSEYRRVWSAKHSKTRSLTAAAQQAMNPVIQSNRVLYSQFYQNVDQSDNACFHYPPVQTGANVIIPGQCDESIPVVQAFDMSNFDGTWYQIQRYDPIGSSTCVGTRLKYSSGSGDIEVLAFEVINGELVTREGFGRVTSSGKLTLAMPAEGSQVNVTTPIYILATDYDKYALAYSCSNIDPFHRQVRAWQLSRERTMPADGVTAINALISRRPELHVPYFLPISHQGECPEPSSAFLFKSSIIVVLVCAVLQLFN